MQCRKRTVVTLALLSSLAATATTVGIAPLAAGIQIARPQIVIESAAGTAVKDRTNQTSLAIRAAKPDDGWAITAVSAGRDGTVPVELKGTRYDFTPFANQGAQQIAVTLTKGEQSVIVLSPLIIDTIGPTVTHVRLAGVKGGDATLEVHFAEADLDETQAKTLDNYKITRLAGSDKFTDESGRKPGTPAIGPDGRVVSIKITDMVTDNYQLEILKGLVDKAGNPAGYRSGQFVAPQRFYFNSYPERVTGQHVEFPDFVPRTKNPPSGFNPGDKVETRVVRLYYYRDAHRVAQIINRNVQSFNRAAVDLKRREASESRDRADSATDERRAKERAAVQAAQDAREAERAVRQAMSDAARAQSALAAAQRNLDAANAQLEQARTDPELSATDPAVAQAAKARLAAAQDAQKNAAQAQAAAAKDARDRDADVDVAEAKLEVKRNVEIAKREESLVAEAKEDRARENQFRKEVAAAHEDPDTYVAGKVESLDPVTQVSVSVIGEGLIQLRGPIRGINRIRTMIDQIDSPVGQVKVGILTVQVNGEHGDRMEKVAQRIEGNIDVSRFLTSQSMMLLRRAVQEVASEVAQQAERGGHYQVDRDRKYLYTFFGRDFIDELYAMDSEFLLSGNKILALHSMDTVSRSNALFIMALARNSIRQRILDRFMHLIECELPQAEYDFRKASKVLPCDRNTRKEIMQKAAELYRFRSLRGMFDVPLGLEHDDLMTPMQREFIRMAQIFKSQMIAEVELKQRVVERGLIEDNANEDERRAQILEPLHEQELIRWRDVIARNLTIRREVEHTVQRAQANTDEVARHLKKLKDAETGVRKQVSTIEGTITGFDATTADAQNLRVETIEDAARKIDLVIDRLIDDSPVLSDSVKTKIRDARKEAHQLYGVAKTSRKETDFQAYAKHVRAKVEEIARAVDTDLAEWNLQQHRVTDALREGLKSTTERNGKTPKPAVAPQFSLATADDSLQDRQVVREAAAGLQKLAASSAEAYTAEQEIAEAERRLYLTRRPLEHRKLLDFLIDEKEEKWIELREGTKAHIATIDNYLKRLAIALEDDFKVQFYDPAFAAIRKAAYEWDVNLGQVERTTILTNNRAFAKVTPQATMEFDLPKRDIVLQEAFKGAKAMVEDYGALMQDPTFLAAAKMLSGSPTASVASAPRGSVPGLPSGGQPGPPVKSVLPGLPSSSEEQVLNQSTGQEREIGAALEALIPDPAIYKFETGTGFEIRPVIQPDGDSVIYDFNYMYTTNVREPVRADEKHLGRVKRHFIDTQVQTSSFELREISRYQVALKASRTSRGVPLFEDIPGVGALFRPLPSDESALQQNIILGQSVVYPTLFDLMGLRWAPHVAELDHTVLRDQQHVVRGRRKTISDFVFDESSSRVDSFLGIKDDPRYEDFRRSDLYREQTRPSPYHPKGYEQSDVEDPLNEGFRVRDRRPPEMRQPPIDSRRGVPIEEDEPLPYPLPSSRSNLRGGRPTKSPTEPERLILTATDSDVVPASHEKVVAPPAKKQPPAQKPAAKPSPAQPRGPANKPPPPAPSAEQSNKESDGAMSKMWKRVTGRAKE